MTDAKESVMDVQGDEGVAASGTEPDPAPETVTCSVSSRDIMLNRVAHSDCHFKHQLIGEPDLTVSEKLTIATAVLDKNPVTFLERFGKILLEQDLSYFSAMKEQYEVNFYIGEIRKNLNDAKNKQKVRNRRYEAMKKLMLETDYFGDEEMKARNPYLYEQLVGQHLSREDVKQQAGKYENLSEMFMYHLQGMKNTVLYDYLKDREDGQMEESDDDEEEEEEIEEQDDQDKETISKSEKQQLRTELVRAMQQRFLDGEDDFDYSQVDNNTEFDSIDIQAQDEEEKYFDEEDEDVMDSVAVEHAGSSQDNDEDDYDAFTVEEDIRPGLCDATTSHIEEDLVENCENKLELNE